LVALIGGGVAGGGWRLLPVRGVSGPRSWCFELVLTLGVAGLEGCRPFRGAGLPGGWLMAGRARRVVRAVVN
jgi:hypothetical protein